MADRILTADGRFWGKSGRKWSDEAKALGTDQLASALLVTEKKYAR
jgi:hypothetical protein